MKTLMLFDGERRIPFSIESHMGPAELAHLVSSTTIERVLRAGLEPEPGVNIAPVMDALRRELAGPAVRAPARRPTKRAGVGGGCC